MPCHDPTQTDIIIERVETAGARVNINMKHAGLLDARVEVPKTAPPVVAIEVRIGFTGWREDFQIDPSRLQPYDTSSPELELYTRKNEGLVQVTPFVIDLAASLGGGLSDWEALQRFWAFFFARMHVGPIHHDELDKTDPLRTVVEQGWCDCFVGAALLVALCRARGMPARLVRGLTLNPRNMGSQHYWLEVLLPPYGWVPLDLRSLGLADDLPGGGLDTSGWGSTFFCRMDYRMKTARFPLRSIDLLGVRFPAAWYMLELPCDGGVEHTTFDAETDEPIFRDRYRVSWLRLDSAA